MLKNLLFYIFTLSSFFIQAQNVDWVQTFGSSGYDKGTSIIIGEENNIYTMGSFSDSVDFDFGSDTSALIHNFSYGGFIMKSDNQGNLIWVKKIHNYRYEGIDMIIDNNGDIVILGEIFGFEDVHYGLIKKFDIDGNEIWSIFNAIYTPYSGGYFNNRSIKTDSQNNIFIVGDFTGHMNSNDSIYYSINFTDIFIQKYNSEADQLWTKTIGGVSDESPKSIAIDIQDDLFITGYFEDSVDFDIGIDTFNLHSNGGKDIFILKLDNDGNFIDAKSFGGIGNVLAFSIRRDNQNHTIVSGYFNDSVDFDPSVGIETIHSNGNYDAFILGLDSDLNFNWVNTFGNFSEDRITDAVIDNSNNVYLTGYYFDTIDFNLGSDTETLASNGSTDIIILKLNQLGEFQWIKSMGGPNIDIAYSIAIDDYENVFVTGFFQNEGVFYQNNDTIHIQSTGTRDIFIQKIAQNKFLAIENLELEYKAPFPNPSSSTFYFELPNEYKKANLSISDNQGRIVYKKQLTKKINTIELSNTIKGIYFYNVEINHQFSYSGKLMID